MTDRKRMLKQQYLAEQRRRERERIALTDAELDDLLDFLDGALGARGCDHTHNLTRRWLARAGKDEAVLDGFRELGGHCDCEILANVDPDQF
jgi:hypothetical protein